MGCWQRASRTILKRNGMKKWLLAICDDPSLLRTVGPNSPEPPLPSSIQHAPSRSPQMSSPPRYEQSGRLDPPRSGLLSRASDFRVMDMRYARVTHVWAGRQMYISIWVHLLLENNRQECIFSTALLLLAKRYQKAPIPQPIRKKLHILLFSKCGLAELQI